MTHYVGHPKAGLGGVSGGSCSSVSARGTSSRQGSQDSFARASLQEASFAALPLPGRRQPQTAYGGLRVGSSFAAELETSALEAFELETFADTRSSGVRSPRWAAAAATAAAAVEGGEFRWRRRSDEEDLLKHCRHTGAYHAYEEMASSFVGLAQSARQAEDGTFEQTTFCEQQKGGWTVGGSLPKPRGRVEGFLAADRPASFRSASAASSQVTLSQLPAAAATTAAATAAAAAREAEEQAARREWEARLTARRHQQERLWAGLPDDDDEFHLHRSSAWLPDGAEAQRLAVLAEAAGAAAAACSMAALRRGGSMTASSPAEAATEAAAAVVAAAVNRGGRQSVATVAARGRPRVPAQEVAATGAASSTADVQAAKVACKPVATPLLPATPTAAGKLQSGVHRSGSPIMGAPINILDLGPSASGPPSRTPSTDCRGGSSAGSAAGWISRSCSSMSSASKGRRRMLREGDLGHTGGSLSFTSDSEDESFAIRGRTQSAASSSQGMRVRRRLGHDLAGDQSGDAAGGHESSLVSLGTTVLTDLQCTLTDPPSAPPCHRALAVDFEAGSGLQGGSAETEAPPSEPATVGGHPLPPPCLASWQRGGLLIHAES
eukprot:TRINITY_DN44996_c0_g1_i1.p1 TRINITY_DN44996_c0_g1~~TRINITY_DN44996_c0_g1_i1.p1  ORF type:complete len:608 (+),score=156.73 TRINITY_DN44996_c0_g1_i1:70-1893(+)